VHLLEQFRFVLDAFVGCIVVCVGYVCWAVYGMCWMHLLGALWFVLDEFVVRL